MKYVLLCSLLISSGAFASKLDKNMRAGSVAVVERFAGINDSKFWGLVDRVQFQGLAIAQQNKLYASYQSIGDKNFLIQNKSALYVSKSALISYGIVAARAE